MSETEALLRWVERRHVGRLDADPDVGPPVTAWPLIAGTVTLFTGAAVGVILAAALYIRRSRR